MISLVIPNYNGADILKKNLPHILKSIEEYRGDSEIVLVDDASSDDSLSFLSSFKKENMSFDISIFKNEKNLGFSSTVNKGVENARGEIIVLLNSDVEPKTDFITYLIPHFKDEKVFAVGCLDESEENGKIIQRGRGVGEWQRGFLVHKRGEPSKKNTLWAAGGSSAFRKSLWEKLGGLDELYNPFYWDDIDLSYRALKSGYKINFERRSIVVHRHSQGAIKKSYSKREIKRIAYRNQLFFVWKNSDLTTLFWHIIWLPYHIVKALFSLNTEFLLGFLYALIKLPKVIESRIEAKKYFVFKDREVVRNFTE